TGAQQALRVNRLVVHRQHEHRELAVLRPNLLDQLEAVAVAEGQIENHDVGTGTLEPEACIAHVRRRPARHQFRLLAQKLGEPLPNDRVVVDADGRTWSRASLLPLRPQASIARRAPAAGPSLPAWPAGTRRNGRACALPSIASSA